MAHYHLSYPPGDSVNDRIPKDPYSLQYVRVDNTISILKSLGPRVYMPKTDLKSEFHNMPIHPDDWNLLGIYWQSHYYVCTSCLGSAVHPSSLIKFRMP